MTSFATRPQIRGAALTRRRFGWPVTLVLTVVLLLTLRAFDSSARSDDARSRFTLPTPRTVFDSSTGLTWQRELDVRACAKATCTWERALAYCDALSLDGGGYRLPTRQELANLTAPDGAAADGDWAAATAEEYFWTSSAVAVNMRGERYSSQSSSIEDEGHTPRVRCVR